MSYLRAGEVEATAWEKSAGSTGSVEADGSRVPWPGEGGLAQCREDELWPLRVFAIVAAWRDDSFRKRGGAAGTGFTGERSIGMREMRK